MHITNIQSLGLKSYQNNCVINNHKSCQHGLINSSPPIKPDYDKFSLSSSGQVSFTGTPNSKILHDILSHNIPDIYSGKILIASKYIKLMVDSKIFKGKSSIAVTKLQEYQNSMLGVEKNVFNIIKRVSARYPDENIQQIMQRIAPKYEKKLIKHQMPIFKNILEHCKDLPENDLKRLNNLFKRVKAQIFDKNNPETFSNKRFASELGAIIPKKKNRKLHFKVMKEVEKLPVSFNFVPSFIVKYSRKSPDAIGTALLSNSTASIEHLHPACLNGPNSLENYSLASKGWNTFFGNMLFYERIAVMPQIKSNVQKQMRILIKLSNEGILRPDYVKKVAETYERESKGLIKINTKKLDDTAYDRIQKENIDILIFLGRLKKYGLSFLISEKDTFPQYRILNNIGKNNLKKIFIST